MKCDYCQEKAGFFKRICKDCDALVEKVKVLPEAFGYRQLLDALMETGASNGKIEKFLHADVDGRGSVNDHITARMTNQVMASMGTPSNLDSKDVKQVRKDIAEGRAPSLVDHEVVDPDHDKH